MNKTIKYISFGMLSVFALSGCSDTFLEDKKNYDNVNGDIYNYEEGCDGRLNDLYAWSLPDVGDVTWKVPSMGNADICAKSTEEYTGFSDFVNPEKELNTMGSTNQVPDFLMGQQNNIQEAVYGRIRNINDFLEHMESSTLTEKQKNIRIGQAYFLRAWCYFNLFKWYGGVPLVTTVQEPVAGEANNTPRSSAKETKNFIISDLDKAAKLLASETMGGGWSGNDWGRVTTGTALALKGRVLQWWCSPLFNRTNDQKRWQEAYNLMKPELDSIRACGYGLFATNSNINGSDFALQFLQSGKNPEAVFVRLYNNVTGDGLDNQKNNVWERGIRPSNTGGGGKGPSAMLVNIFPMKDGKIPAGTGTYTKLETSQYEYVAGTEDGDGETVPFLNRDPRFYRTFAFPGFRWAYNGDASLINANNPSNGKDYTLWNYVWYVDKNDEGNPESGNSYGADNLLGSKQGIYIRKKSDDLDVNSSALYNYVAGDTKGAAPYYSAAPLIELRYAEVLLNLAEVACMAGHTDEAASLLQQVRDRAGVPAYTNLSDQATCMSAILYERQIELAYEGKRFDDMRRWLLFDGGSKFGTISGAPSTWTLSGWGGNTCTWLGVKEFNGQRRESISFRTANKYGVGATTFDSDPLLKDAIADKAAAYVESHEGVTLAQAKSMPEVIYAAAEAVRPSGLDLRRDITDQQETLAEWYAENLVYQLKRGDGYDSQHNLEYISYRPNYYILGMSSGAQSAAKMLPQTIGWQSYPSGAAGTFDPLAE